MGDFSYVGFATYQDIGTLSFLTGSSTSSGTIADQDNDDQFEVDTVDIFPPNGTDTHGGWTYTGTWNFGSGSMPMFYSGGYYRVYNPGPNPVSWPSLGPDVGNINVFAFCFLKGTAIATADGEVSVEKLAIGSRILTATGQEIAVKWIGRQTVSTRFGPAERLMPVRFAAGSLGEDQPHTHLTVTTDHGMLVDGVICHAGALVNGTTITRVPLAEMGESYTVYHIETDAHEIILANGAPAETFIDNAGRQAFDNFAEFDALYGTVPEMEELPYPRAMSFRQVPQSIQQRLAVRNVA